MRTFEDLVSEAAGADVDGWGFGWLAGRATEERPPWGYAALVGRRLATAGSALDIDTGGGEVVAGAPVLPERMCVTESWPPNAVRARELLGPRGVEVLEPAPGAPLPVQDGTFELVTSRHPVAADWPEIARVLAPGGRYLAQHVGPESAFDLIEHFLTPTLGQRRSRHPDDDRTSAEAAGLEVLDLRTARCRMEFLDVGAVVFLLRKCVWWVPDFDVARHDAVLRRLDAHIRTEGSLVAHSTRHLIEARRPVRAAR
ncbi:methyltransferase type 11 [Pseudonocardia sp. HH130630-07]|uniref:methyltransferase type 11 n=1 Tax=Pseudonocardia sp. HH130630-07 TaxID=1690815 RepID=UPI000814C952|nr:methyltransferase type 11 [Pseudonocardia sp. HH130630-07]ANY09931.1 methyltransferase type 11 [Pseudonocardia sp. HH130630-07]